MVDTLNMSEGFATIEGNEARPNSPEARKGVIRILIADDHPIVRDGLKKLLLLEDDFEVVGEAGDGREVLEKVRQLDPDVLLLDLRMPNLDGLSALQDSYLQDFYHLAYRRLHGKDSSLPRRSFG